MCRDGHLPPNDRLDQAIQEALRVEADQERLERLEDFWIIQSRKQRRRRLAFRAVPVAASVLVLIAAVALRWNRSEEPQLAENIRDAAPVRNDSEPAESPVSKEAQPREDSLSAGRPPSAYERLVFSARTNMRRPTLTKASRIDRAIQQLTLDPSADAKQKLAFSGIEPADAETLLLERLPRAEIAQQVIIFRLLEVCGTQRSIPTLLRSGRQDELRDRAVTTIEKIVGIDSLAKVVGLTRDDRLRATLMLRLLSADSDAAVRGYLSLVRTEAVRPEALAVAEHAKQLPVTTLLAFLDDEDGQVRLPAALVLGHVNGPEVTKLLIERVTNHPSNSTEAWLALLACRGDLAEEFLAYAARQPKLLGHRNYAYVQWTQMIP